MGIYNNIYILYIISINIHKVYAHIIFHIENSEYDPVCFDYE